MLERKRNRHARGITRRKAGRFSESLRRQTEIKLNKRKRCNKKRRYETEEKAQAHCEKMKIGITLQITPMEPYFCYRHQTWHIGHNWRKYNLTKGE